MKAILIGGGSFQGKSLVALEMGHRFSIPAIVCTDTVRSMMHVVYPEDSAFFTSTYLMTPENLREQMNRVSRIIHGLIEIFEKRGESLVLEGMHFNDSFIEYMSQRKDSVLMCLDNNRPFRDMVLSKAETRSRVEYLNLKTGEIEYGSISRDNVDETPYMNYAKRITEIHEDILHLFRKRKLPIIRYKNLDEAIEKAADIVSQWFNESPRV